MIQILGLRPYFDNKTGTEKLKDEFFTKNWRAPSVIDLIENYETYLEKIPPIDRYNIFFTQYQAGSKKRAFSEQWVIPFDIDGVEPSLMPEMESESKRAIAELKGLGASINPYLELVCKTLGLNMNETGAIFTGHGLHLIVALKTAFTSATFFTEMRPHYNAVCNKLNFELAKAGLPGALDPGIFNQGVIGFRMPGTENRKTDKPPVITKLLQRKIVPVDFDLTQHSGIPVVKSDDQVKTHKFFKVDTQAVLSGCDFLKHAKEHPNHITANEWYAMLSIVGRCEDGGKLSHEYSRGHVKYNEAETEEKLARALEASGPRTCKNINDLWGMCQGCPNFEKVKSPIVLKGVDYIETQDSGFHSVFEKDGVLKKGKPVYEDLRRFFDQKYKYRVMGESGICYVWTGTHYETMADPYLKEYAQTHFNPVATMGMRQEFKDLVCSMKLTPPNWFQETTERRINFKNGVLDLGTGDLWPHDRELGFRYCLPYDYDPGARCPQFDKFLDQVMCGDQDLIHLLLEFAGYAFSGEFPRQEKTLVLTGKGSNGKSTFIDVLKALAGKSNYSALDWKAMRNETFRQGMDGKLFNLAEESPKDAFKDPTFFKCVISGGEMLINVKYKQPYSIVNKTKLIWACNELPTSDDTTWGFFRKLLIIPFNAEFSDEKGNIDKDLREKLSTELSGIFNHILKGHERLTKQKMFTSARESKNELDSYRSQVDHATRWIKENVTWTYLNGGERFAIIPEMYQCYRTEMMNTGERPVTAVHFGKKLSQIIPEYDTRVKQKKLHGKNNRVILDCSYQSDESQ
jgi:P4 family phage/plasmid primase-like protien